MKKKHNYAGGKGGGGAKKVTNKWMGRAKTVGAAKGKKPKSRGKKSHGY